MNIIYLSGIIQLFSKILYDKDIYYKQCVFKDILNRLSDYKNIIKEYQHMKVLITQTIKNNFLKLPDMELNRDIISKYLNMLRCYERDYYIKNGTNNIIDNKENIIENSVDNYISNYTSTVLIHCYMLLYKKYLLVLSRRREFKY